MHGYKRPQIINCRRFHRDGPIRTNFIRLLCRTPIYERSNCRGYIRIPTCKTSSSLKICCRTTGWRRKIIEVVCTRWSPSRRSPDTNSSRDTIKSRGYASCQNTYYSTTTALPSPNIRRRVSSSLRCDFFLAFRKLSFWSFFNSPARTSYRARSKFVVDLFANACFYTLIFRMSRIIFTSRIIWL